MRWLFDSIVVVSSTLLGLYVGLLQRSGIDWDLTRQVESVTGAALYGFAIGLLLAVLLRVLEWVLRKFRAYAPRTARYLGSGLFWIGLAMAAWSLGSAAYAWYDGATVKLVSLLAADGLLYGLGGWGIRYSLVS
jgi:hypothetical protein